MKVYLVRSSWGDYSDAGERIERVYSSRAKAVEYIKGQGIGVYEEDGSTFACWDIDDPSRTVYPTWDGRSWSYKDVHYTLDTKYYDIIEMEVDE